MKLKIKKDYYDKEQGGMISAGKVVTVSEERGQQLVGANVAEEVKMKPSKTKVTKPKKGKEK